MTVGSIKQTVIAHSDAQSHQSRSYHLLHSCAEDEQRQSNPLAWDMAVLLMVQQAGEMLPPAFSGDKVGAYAILDRSPQ